MTPESPRAPLPNPDAQRPSSSRMLTGYLNDIEELLDGQRWGKALREAADLPLIAAALTDPGLKSSEERVRTWCREWVGDARGDGRIGRRVEQLTIPNTSPVRALRRLQLRRDAPTAPRGFPATAPPSNLDQKDSEAVETCTALLDATRRWYARCACHDVSVQNNLARLAVLR